MPTPCWGKGLARKGQRGYNKGKPLWEAEKGRIAMTEVERKFYRLLLAADAAAIIISMVAGPLQHTAMAIGAAVSAGLISVCLVASGLYFWPFKT